MREQRLANRREPLATDLTELRVFQEAEKLADKVWQTVESWNRFEKRTVGEQFIRAADSVGANIAEAQGRFHFGERIQILYYARGSLFEVRFWLRRAYQRGLVNLETGQAIAEHFEALAKGINSHVRSLKEQRTDASLRETRAEYAPKTKTLSNLSLSNLKKDEVFSQEEIQWLTNLPANAS